MLSTEFRTSLLLLWPGQSRARAGSPSRPAARTEGRMPPVPAGFATSTANVARERRGDEVDEVIVGALDEIVGAHLLPVAFTGYVDATDQGGPIWPARALWRTLIMVMASPSHPRPRHLVRLPDSRSSPPCWVGSDGSGRCDSHPLKNIKGPGRHPEVSKALKGPRRHLDALEALAFEKASRIVGGRSAKVTGRPRCVDSHAAWPGSSSKARTEVTSPPVGLSYLSMVNREVKRTGFVVSQMPTSSSSATFTKPAPKSVSEAALKKST